MIIKVLYVFFVCDVCGKIFLCNAPFILLYNFTVWTMIARCSIILSSQLNICNHAVEIYINMNESHLNK